MTKSDFSAVPCDPASMFYRNIEHIPSGAIVARMVPIEGVEEQIRYLVANPPFVNHCVSKAQREAAAGPLPIPAEGLATAANKLVTLKAEQAIRALEDLSEAMMTAAEVAGSGHATRACYAFDDVRSAFRESHGAHRGLGAAVSLCRALIQLAPHR